jgi:hypothetical protein
MIDLADLRDGLLSGFRTVHIPASARSPEPTGWLGIAKARRAEQRAAETYRDGLHRQLVQHGHHRFLHRLETDADGGWRLHLFLADKDAVAFLKELTNGACGPGDPVTLNAEEFVHEHIAELADRDSHSE